MCMCPCLVLATVAMAVQCLTSLHPNTAGSKSDDQRGAELVVEEFGNIATLVAVRSCIDWIDGWRDGGMDGYVGSESMEGWMRCGMYMYGSGGWRYGWLD